MFSLELFRSINGGHLRRIYTVLIHLLGNQSYLVLPVWKMEIDWKARAIALSCKIGCQPIIEEYIVSIPFLSILLAAGWSVVYLADDGKSTIDLYSNPT